MKVKAKKMSEGLANVLEIVGLNHLYPYLRFNDLLRLRRLCKWSLPLAEDYLRLKASTQKCIKVSPDPEEPNNLSSFLNLPFTVPLCHISIENQNGGNQIWDSNMEEHASKFLELYGQTITHLKLGYLELPMGPEALAFFESLPYLEHLEIDSVYLMVKEKRTNEFVLPSTFRKLKKLCIQNYFWIPVFVLNIAHKRQIFVKILEWCQPCLESFQHADFFPHGVANPLAEIFETVRTTLIQVENPKLKIYDLNCCVNLARDNAAAGMDFYRLLTACYQKNVKLCNFQIDTAALEDLEEKLSDVIMSMDYVRSGCFYLELSNLEAMQVSDAFSGFLSYPVEEFERKAWSNLKRLRIHVTKHEVPMPQLLNYFFVGIQREKMEQLDLEFDGNTLPFPKALDIGRSCPNLKELRFRGWPENNLAISQLWELLPLLEVLEFDRCCELTMQAFIGENREEPSFLKLKNLYRLILSDLGRMPMITDDLFVTVLRHMPLKELYLVASDQHNNLRTVSQITVAGIRSLKTGVFAESIERFPLRGILELENVSEKQLSLLEKEFRSYNML